MKYWKLFLLLIFLGAVSSPSFAAKNHPPRITVLNLFEEIIISSSYEGWSIAGTALLNEWPRSGIRQDKLSEIRQKGLYILSHPLTNKPVRVTEENASFFEGLPLEFKRDGSLMAYKYIFCPSSVLSAKDSKDPGAPISFYLIKEVPNFLEEDEFDTPLSQDKLDKFITNLNNGYACYHASCLFNTKQERDMATQMCFVSAELANPQAQFEVACKSTDNSQKFKFCKLAAEQGHTEAQSLYEVMLASEKESNTTVNSEDNSAQDISRVLKRKYEPTPEQQEDEGSTKKPKQ